MRLRMLCAGAATLGVVLAAAPSTAAPAPAGEVYLIQGIVGSTWDFSIDDKEVEQGAAAKEIVGPLDLSPGQHKVTATSEDGTSVESMVRVAAGKSFDVVLHLPVDATKKAVLTSFVNDLAAVPDGQSRLSIAHTAAVGPADIKVDGRVLFADVASGEELTVTVPADTYNVAVVPTSGGPPVLGPLDLAVPAGKSLRVFAIGVAAKGTMDAVVHEMPVQVRGSDRAPADVPGGSGGQQASAQGLGSGVLLGGGVAALLAAGLLSWIGITRRGAVGPR